MEKVKVTIMSHTGTQKKIPNFLSHNLHDTDDIKREKWGQKIVELVPYLLYPIK